MRIARAILFAAAGAAAISSLLADEQADKLLNTWESSSFSFLPRSFQKDPKLNVMINTEFTKIGRTYPKASAEHPVYYIGHDIGEAEIGDIIAGERKPKDSDLNTILTKALAAGGYFGATKAHPPSIMVAYRWGSFNAFSNIDGSDAGTEPDDDTQATNLIQRAALVGGTKFAVELTEAMNAGMVSQFENRSARNQYLMQEARANRYFVIATAYDLSQAEQGKSVIIWRTKISTDSQGVAMDESLPGLIAVAGPYLGHETDGAVKLNRAVIREGTVTVGTPIVKGELPSDAPLPQPQAPNPPAEPAAPSSHP